MTASDEDENTFVLPKITPEKLLNRQEEERKDLKKRHDRIRSSIPKKDRSGRSRAAEEASADEQRLLAAQKEEREELGITEEMLAEQLARLNVSDASADTAAPAQQTGSGGGDGDSASTSAAAPKESKAARRRRKKAEEEAASARRVEEARNAMGPSPKMVEMQAINAQLKPLSLRIHPIAADGHCLYGAVAHQMVETGLSSDLAPTVDHLRVATANHLLAHRAEFMPFIESVSGDDAMFDKYCDTVRDTAEWGGQVELRAMAERLDAVIEVYAADMPIVKMGGQRDDAQVLRVSFHRQYLGLGEHYNSIVHSS